MLAGFGEITVLKRHGKVDDVVPLPACRNAAAGKRVREGPEARE